VPHKYLIHEFEEFARSAASAEPLMQQVADRIHIHSPRYNWVGFYLVDKSNPDDLVLGPHTGSFTPNERISLDEGLCGAAASTGQVVVADNVLEDPRYLQASDMVKSQIAAPLWAGRMTVGVFNVESYFMSTFRPSPEREFVERCARIVGLCIEKNLAGHLVTA
jgi:L-methionine (R)-S-oxide reductase